MAMSLKTTGTLCSAKGLEAISEKRLRGPVRVPKRVKQGNDGTLRQVTHPVQMYKLQHPGYRIEMQNSHPSHYRHTYV